MEKLKIGKIYTQNIDGTIFKLKVIRYIGKIMCKHHYLVKNIETEVKFVIKAVEVNETKDN